jgi:hypothetical protein
MTPRRGESGRRRRQYGNKEEIVKRVRGSSSDSCACDSPTRGGDGKEIEMEEEEGKRIEEDFEVQSDLNSWVYNSAMSSVAPAEGINKSLSARRVPTGKRMLRAGRRGKRMRMKERRRVSRKERRE